MPDFIIGKDAKIYRGDAGDAIGDMTLMDNIQDLTLPMEAGEADITTRANSGWRATAAALRDCGAEFEMLWIPGDADLDAIQTAFLAGSTIELAILDQLRETAGAQGPKGTFSILNFSRNEPLEEGMTVNVTAKLTSFDQWIDVAS